MKNNNNIYIKTFFIIFVQLIIVSFVFYYCENTSSTSITTYSSTSTTQTNLTAGSTISNNEFLLVGTDDIGDASSGAGDIIELYVKVEPSIESHYTLTFKLIGSSNLCTIGSDIFFHGTDTVAHYYLGYYNNAYESGRYHGHFHADSAFKGTGSCTEFLGEYSIHTENLDSFAPKSDENGEYIGIWAGSWDTTSGQDIGDDYLASYTAPIKLYLPNN